MVDLEAHCFPPATSLGGGGVTWVWGSPSLVILVLFSCFSDAIESASCVTGLGPFVFL